MTRLDYCQYLLVSQINYTLTNFADYCAQFSHDAINRSLCGERITPRLVWENVRGQVVPTPHGYAGNIQKTVLYSMLQSAGRYNHAWRYTPYIDGLSVR